MGQPLKSMAQQDDERDGQWFITYTGRKFWPMDPRPGDIFLRDIAHALANVCRFGGHTIVHYSVAQHSCLVADLLPPYLKFQGLMHDVTEAYCGDLVRPLKYQLPAYLAAEKRIWKAVCQQFGLPERLDPMVKRADNVALMMERRDLINLSGGYKWSLDEEGFKPDDLTRIRPLLPRNAEIEFLRAYHEAVSS